MARAAARRGPLEDLVGGTHLGFCLVTQGLDAVSAVQSVSDLLVRLHEALQLGVQLDVLAGEDVTVVLKGVHLGAQVTVLALHRLCGEAEVVLLASLRGQVVICGTTLGLEVVECGREISVAAKLAFRAANELRLFTHLEVERAAQLRGLVHVAGLIIAPTHEVCAGSLVGLSGAAELKLTRVSLLGQLRGTLLSLVQVVVSGLDAAVLVRVLPSLHGVEILGALNFILVAAALLLELGQFVTGVVNFFAEGVAAVGLLGDIALRGEDLGLATGDLLAGGGDLGLEVIVRPVLLVEQETGVVDLLLEALEGEDVGVVAGLEVVVLQELFVLEVAVLGLDGVELVAQCEVVFVALLNLEDLGLQLGDEEVFLVASQVDAVVVLKNNS